MKVLIIGGNSYIAQSFFKLCSSSIECTVIARGGLFTDYFHLDETVFKGFDAVMLCAAIVHQSTPDPIETNRINTNLPLYLAKLAKSAGVLQFVHMSTIAVYGEDMFIEPSNDEFPTTLYGKTKLLGDRNLLQLNDSSFQVAIIRPPMVYGFGAPGNFRRLSRLISQIPILPFGNNVNRRSIIYIENLVCALEKIILKRESGIFLVRDSIMPSIAVLSQGVINALGLYRILFSLPESIVRFLSQFQALPFKQLYGTLEIDDTLTRQKIGDYAIIPLAEALERTLNKGCV